MARRLALVSAPLERLFRWWIGELAALVPARLRERLAATGNTLVVFQPGIYGTITYGQRLIKVTVWHVDASGREHLLTDTTASSDGEAVHKIKMHAAAKGVPDTAIFVRRR
jgi:hypothetical protein